MRKLFNLSKLVLYLYVLVFLSFFLTSCKHNQSEEVYRETRFLFETEVFIEASGTGSEQAIKNAMKIMKEIDHATSFYSTDSEITKLNEAAGEHPVSLSKTLFELLQRSLQIADLTNGFLDPTVGPLVRLWQEAKMKNSYPSSLEIEKQLQLVGYQELILNTHNLTAFLPEKGMSIDLSAIAKGFAVGKGIEVLKEAGITSAMVRAGGNVYTIGNKPDNTSWKVGIRDPHQLDMNIGYLEPQNKVIDTSGNYEQSHVVDGVNIGHIFDPQTGLPSEKIASCTIVSVDPVLADALSTTVFIIGIEKGLELIEKIPETEGIIIGNDGSQSMSTGFENMFKAEN